MLQYICTSCTTLARIDFDTAKYCKGIGSFYDAAFLLQRGLDLLSPVEKWNLHFDLPFNMTEVLSKMDLIIGNHESCKEKAHKIMLQAKATKMKANALLTEVECCMTCHEMDNAIAAAN
jgi:hypothetical protein